MRIVVLGASGGCGRWVTRLARDAGHRVRALIRLGTQFTAPNGVDVRVGSAIDVVDVASAMEQQEIVISCIGPQRMRVWNPWSALRTPLGVAELSTRAIMDGVAETSVRRVVVISAAGVGESLANTTAAMRWMIAHSTIGDMYKDLGRMEHVLQASDADWVAVRPVTLVNARPSRRIRVLKAYRSYSIVGRADVAGYLLGVATGAEPETRTPMIGWW